MLTKSEQKILDGVSVCNIKFNALRGLGTNPHDPDFGSRENRFIRRLYESGVIVWVESPERHGKGWALKEHVHLFS